MTGDDVSDWAAESNTEFYRGSTKLTQFRTFARSQLFMFVIVISVFASVAISCGPVTPVEEISETSGLSERPFPIELQDESEPLDSADVVSAYIEYFSNARLTPREAVESGSASAITDYCSDFTGQVVLNPPITGAVFTWNIRKPDELAWNNVLLIVNFVDPTVPEKLGQRKGSLISIPWGPATLGTTAVFRSPLCGT